jgi:hypothetical protein
MHSEDVRSRIQSRAEQHGWTVDVTELNARRPVVLLTVTRGQHVIEALLQVSQRGDRWTFLKGFAYRGDHDPPRPLWGPDQTGRYNVLAALGEPPSA